MKKYIFLALAAALLAAAAVVFARQGASIPSVKDDGDGHTLTAKWSEYEKAALADRPKKEIQILNEIKAEAIKQHLAADFYDAARLCVDRGRRINWKDTDSLKRNLAAEVKIFADPLITFLWGEEYGGMGMSTQLDLVNAHQVEMQHARRSYLWRLSYGLDASYQYFITNDYEYTLWRLMTNRSFNAERPEGSKAYVALKDYLKESYPGAGRLAYYVASHRNYKNSRLADMRVLAEQYKGKALALFPREDLLKARFDSLERAKAPESEFRVLYDDCKSYLKEFKGYSGDEKRLVSSLGGVERLSEMLTDERIDLTVKNDTVIVYFRNTSKAVLTLYERKSDGATGKQLKTWNITNKKNSFYLIDKERVALPVLNDGDYRLEVVSGKLSDRYDYTAHTLSLALRKDADTPRFYVADYVTGEPLEAVTLKLYKDSDLIKEQTVSQRGFTPLPASFVANLKKYVSYHIQASYRDAKGRLHLSNSVSLYSWTVSAYDDKFSNDIFCHVYKDKGAYNPDDVMHFKAVLFRGDLRSEVAVLPAGEKVDVKLMNASGKEIASRTFTLTEYGSISGEFLLERGERNGYYSLELSYGGKSVGSDSFRVDDFILPTFTVSLDRTEELLTRKDTVKVRGKVESFSGHSLTSATVRAKVERYGSPARQFETSPGPDGSFSFQFVADNTGGYSIDVTVTDGTGESATASKYIYVVSSFSIGATLANKSAATSFLIGDESQTRPVRYYRPYRPVGTAVLSDTKAELILSAKNNEGAILPIDVSWELFQERDTSVVLRGTTPSGEKLILDLAPYQSGLFRVAYKAEARDHDGNVMHASGELRFLVVKPSDKKLDAPVRRVFIPGETFVEAGQPVSVRFGSNDGPTWAVATLYGLNCQVLETKILKIKGGTLEDISFTYKESYPDAVRIRIFYFKYGEAVGYDRVFRKVRHSLDLPVSFSSFTDKTRPGTQYTFSVKAAPDVEALAAVWDKSLDAIARNNWDVVKAADLTISSVSINSVEGRVSGGDPYRFSPRYKPQPAEDGFPVEEVYENLMYKSVGSTRALQKSVGGEAVLAAAPMAMEAVMEDSAVSDDSAAAKEATAEEAAAAAQVSVREVFADALTFQPHLRSDASGEVQFTFSTSDKLSTYYVGVYAHGKDMRNGLTVQQMKVTVPVKVAVVEPKYLYETDSYTLSTTVSSNSEDTVAGKLYLFVYPGTDHEHLEPVSALVREVSIPAGSSVSETFDVKPAQEGTLGVKIVFVASEGESSFSDAVFVPIEVKRAAQTLTEAHSAVWLHGTDKEALKAQLRGRFVNVAASEASYSEISILDMVKEALPKKFEPRGKDVVSLSETYYVRLITSLLQTGSKDLPEGSGEILEKILACRNSDGGFAWFEGMSSSRILTAVILERFAILRDRGFSVPDLSAAVKFLDKGQFSEAYPVWCGWLSDEQYLYVRSMYSKVPFEWTPQSKEDKERFAQFKKETKAYLVPSKKDGRGLQGYILGKARRIKTLRALIDSPEGIALAKAFGVKLSAKNRMDKSMVADLLSLVEYSVKHPDGGYYYPNAVMPWRGLLESEAYAHSLICDLLTSVGMEKNAAIRSETGDDAGVIADGIRLWLMLQKETQKWEEDPGFVNAISSILDGSEAVLATEILIYKATYTKPFAEIEAAGNGFTVSRQFFRETGEKHKLEAIEPGTILRKGDRVVIKYEIWNKENRSFVKLTAPREASLRPVNQLSGHVGWWLRPLTYGGWYTFSPQGYRNVLHDKTEYFFDTYPEENTTVSEEFFVTQAGKFSAPVIEIESLYAPHYRANGAFAGEWVSR